MKNKFCHCQGKGFELPSGNRILPLFLFFFLLPSVARVQEIKNLVLITLDGVRWQEVFQGVDTLMWREFHKSRSGKNVLEWYGPENHQSSREKLMPFIWNQWYKQCSLYGNRLWGNYVNTANNAHFSYPSYNEMLTGQPDPSIRTNARKQNKNVTILEHLHRSPVYSGKIAVFSSWDRFPYILNATRSGLLVNSGRRLYDRPDDSFQHHINAQLSGVPRGLDYRPDKLTYQMAKHHILQHRPRLVFLAFNDTDEYAHQGRYDLYLDAIHRIDSMIRDLHTLMESLQSYQGQTAYLVTTDHGRGDNISGSWRKHNKHIPGSDQVWLIECIPGCPALGEVKYQQQRMLGEVHSLISAILHPGTTDATTFRMADSAVTNSKPCIISSK